MPTLFTALVGVAGFLLGLRAGLAIGRKNALRELARRGAAREPPPKLR